MGNSIRSNKELEQEQYDFNESTLFICGGLRYDIDSTSTIKFEKEKPKDPLQLTLELKFDQNVSSETVFKFIDLATPPTDPKSTLQNFHFLNVLNNGNSSDELPLSFPQLNIWQNRDNEVEITISFKIAGKKVQHKKEHFKG